MLMKDNDKKKSVALIMSKLGKTEEPKMSEDGTEQDDSVALKTAAEELIAAISSKDAMQVVEAFKSMMSMCESESEDESGAEIEIETK